MKRRKGPPPPLRINDPSTQNPGSNNIDIPAYTMKNDFVEHNNILKHKSAFLSDKNYDLSLEDFKQEYKQELEQIKDIVSPRYKRVPRINNQPGVSGAARNYICGNETYVLLEEDFYDAVKAKNLQVLIDYLLLFERYKIVEILEKRKQNPEYEPEQFNAEDIERLQNGQMPEDEFLQRACARINDTDKIATFKAFSVLAKKKKLGALIDDIDGYENLLRALVQDSYAFNELVGIYGKDGINHGEGKSELDRIVKQKLNLFKGLVTRFGLIVGMDKDITGVEIEQNIEDNKEKLNRLIYDVLLKKMA